jgi:hypothetical protein
MLKERDVSVTNGFIWHRKEISCGLMQQIYAFHRMVGIPILADQIVVAQDGPSSMEPDTVN